MPYWNISYHTHAVLRNDNYMCIMIALHCIDREQHTEPRHYHLPPSFYSHPPFKPSSRLEQHLPLCITPHSAIEDYHSYHLYHTSHPPNDTDREYQCRMVSRVLSIYLVRQRPRLTSTERYQATYLPISSRSSISLLRHPTPRSQCHPVSPLSCLMTIPSHLPLLRHLQLRVKTHTDPRRRAQAAPRPSSARAAGAGGSSNTMLKLYTDSGEAGLKV
jgi:hypothetical protein